MAWAEKRGLMVLRVSFFLLVFRQAASVTPPPVQACETKVIVCERQSTEINCGEGLINICTAVYGRTARTTCPNLVSLVLGVLARTCGVDVVAVLGPDCNGNSQCTISANNGLSGDPCQGTYKYVEVTYTCKVLPMTTATTIGPSLPASVLPMTTVTAIGPSSPVSDTSSTGSISPVIPAVVVVVVVFLIVVISGVICYKRRHLSRSKDRDPHLDAPANVLNPSFRTSAAGQSDYTECANPIEGASNAAMSLSYENIRHIEYSDFPTSVPPTRQGNMVIYNEVGEQDYNVLFGGKEQGDYHEYNLPESAQKTPSGPYQELLKGGMQGRFTEGSSPKGTLVNGTECALVEAKPKDLHGQKKRGVPNETVDQGYQDLRKDDTNYTSLHLNATTPTKPEDSSVASMNNTYQALQTSSPDYAIQEPKTNDPSPAYPKPGSLSNNDHQSVEKNETGSDDTAHGFDQGGVSVKQDASQNNTYQHLIKDDNTPESMNGYTKATGKDKDNNYDALQHGPKTSGHPPSNGYGSLGMVLWV
eukprot:XP_011662040.1 PREDICTED: uncharacterized protein LOC105437294 [Strongylocentrotus purpuratus]